jgi:hypothetical protein
MRKITVTETLTLQPIFTRKPGVTKKHQEAIFKEQISSIAFLENQIIVIGQPPNEYEDANEDTHHNCDEMGCGWEHVLMRIDVESITNIHSDIPTRMRIGDGRI